MEWLDTIKENWFTLLQIISIVSGLIFTGVSFLIDARSRRIGHLIDFTKQHREIWKELRDRPTLTRVLQSDINLLDYPITLEEERFVNSLILHLNATHQAIEVGLYTSPDGLQRDVQEFFALPIPNTIWAKFKNYQDKAFVDFIERSINRGN